MTTRRLVRRAPLSQRIKAYLDPYDLYLRLSEEINSDEWDDFARTWATVIGISLNVLLAIVRARTSTTKRSATDDVFNDLFQESSLGWLSLPASFLSYALATLSILNAYSTFSQTRRYRLFENAIETKPDTTSARRVHVSSSPSSYPKLRVLASLWESEEATDRAFPDPTREVWEISKWDPTYLNIRVFCLFSPGHVVLYWLFLPLAPLDPRPSVTVVTIVVLLALLSMQMMFLQEYFSQQAKDSALIQRQVQNEYDTKYVHPTVYRRVRDVGTQMKPKNTLTSIREVQTFTPTMYVNRGFQTHPNKNYLSHVDPEAEKKMQARSSNELLRAGLPAMVSPPRAAPGSSSPIKAHMDLLAGDRNDSSMERGSGARNAGKLERGNHLSSPLNHVTNRTQGVQVSPTSGSRKTSGLRQPQVGTTPGNIDGARQRATHRR